MSNMFECLNIIIHRHNELRKMLANIMQYIKMLTHFLKFKYHSARIGN